MRLRDNLGAASMGSTRLGSGDLVALARNRLVNLGNRVCIRHQGLAKA